MVLRFFIVSSVASFSLSSNSTFGVESAGSKSCSFVSFASASMVEHLSSSYGLTVPSNSAMLALRLVSFVTLGEDLHQVFAGAVRGLWIVFFVQYSPRFCSVASITLVAITYGVPLVRLASIGWTCLLNSGRSLSGELFLSDDRPVKELARGFESVAGNAVSMSMPRAVMTLLMNPLPSLQHNTENTFLMTSLKLEPTSDDKNSRSRHQVRVPKHPHSLRKERDV